MLIICLFCFSVIYNPIFKGKYYFDLVLFVLMFLAFPYFNIHLFSSIGKNSYGVYCLHNSIISILLIFGIEGKSFFNWSLMLLLVIILSFGLGLMTERIVQHYLSNNHRYY